MLPAEDAVCTLLLGPDGVQLLSGLCYATALDTLTARPDLSERACLLTVPSQATVKSLSSPLNHRLDAVRVERTASLVQMTGVG